MTDCPAYGWFVMSDQGDTFGGYVISFQNGLAAVQRTASSFQFRCGSVVFNAQCVPTPRPYTHYQEYCLYLMDGSCGVCMQRCPVGAIGPDGHDKLKCREYLMVTLVEWVKKPRYMGAYSACGLCQTYVPCESQIPSRKTT